MLAVHLLRKGDTNRFGDLITCLDKAATLGRDEYPTNTTDAFDVAMIHDVQHQSITDVRRYSGRGGRGGRFGRDGGRNFTFTQVDGRGRGRGRGGSDDSSPPVVGHDGNTAMHVVCYNCRNRGNYSATSAGEKNCPQNGNNTNLHNNIGRYLSGVVLTQLGGDVINK